MDFELILLYESGLREELANVLALISLQLKNLTILGMFDDGAVTSEFLKIRTQQQRTVTPKVIECESAMLTFLHVLTIFFKS